MVPCKQHLPRPQRSSLLRLLTLPPRVSPQLPPLLQLSAMLVPTLATHTPLATNTPLASHMPMPHMPTLATHTPLDSEASLPTPTEPSSQSTSQLSTLPRSSTSPLTDSQPLHWPHTPTPLDTQDSWPTPTVPLSHWSPLML